MNIKDYTLKTDTALAESVKKNPSSTLLSKTAGMMAKIFVFAILEMPTT